MRKLIALVPAPARPGRRSPRPGVRAADTAKIVLIAGRPSHGPGRPRVQRRLQAAGQVPVRGAGHRAGGRHRRLARGRVGLRRRPHARLLHGRRRRPPDDPGGPPGNDPEADGQGRRPGLPALRRRGPQGEAGRQVPRLDRRLLRDRLLDQPALDGRHQEPARAPDHPGRQAVRRQRRVVLQHPVPPGHEGRHADPRRQARRRDPQGRVGSSRAGRTSTSSKPRAATRSSPGRSSGPTAAAGSASPAPTSTRTGATPISASWSSTRSSGRPSSTCPPEGVESTVTDEELKQNLDPKR